MSSLEQPIRVLHVIGSMNFGGAESMIMNLYRAIDRSKVQFDFLVHTEKQGSFDQEILSYGGRIFHINRFNGVNLFSYYHECLSFFRKHPEYHVVHGHIGSCASVYLYAAKKMGVFTIAHSHSAGDKSSFKDFTFDAVSFPTRFIADEFIGCSEKAAISRYGKSVIKKPNYLTFPNAIDTELYKYDKKVAALVREEFGILPDEIVIGAVGRIAYPKNPEKIFEIFRSAVVKDNVKCIWVGYGEKESIFRKTIEQDGLTNRIIMTGKRNDVYRVLQAFDVFIMPSVYEGLPVSAVEAQCSGIPCVLADTISSETAITDLVRWMTLEESAEKWADIAIMLALDNQHKRMSPIPVLKNAGYDVKDAVSKLTELYLNADKQKQM